MKHFFLFISLLPLLVTAQTKSKTKPAPVKKAVAALNVPADGFAIHGEVTGFADGTTVALLNGQTGTPEAETRIVKNKFAFAGKVAAPDFKIVLFNKQPPYLVLFLDNSTVNIKASKDALGEAVVTGSATHKDYETLLQAIQPYQKLFAENAAEGDGDKDKALAAIEQFIKQHPASFVAPLAIIRYNQLSEDAVKMEAMYNDLNGTLKASSMGTYIAQQIAESKKNAIGTMLPDFTQPDTTGAPVSLSSLRGKFVLVDFWASWCRPCRQENPNVVDNYNKFKDKNFTVLGVSLDKAKPSWVDAIKMDGLAWNHVSDLQGWSNAVAQQLGIFSIPQNFLIDPNGKIVAKNLRGPALEKKLNALLK
jgi:peroxiredoxin